MDIEWAANSYLMLNKLMIVMYEFEAYGIKYPTKIWHVENFKELGASWENDKCGVTLHFLSAQRSPVTYSIFTERKFDGWASHKSGKFEYDDIPREIWDIMEEHFAN